MFLAIRGSLCLWQKTIGKEWRVDEDVGTLCVCSNCVKRWKSMENMTRGWNGFMVWHCFAWWRKLVVIAANEDVWHNTGGDLAS